MFKILSKVRIDLSKMLSSIDILKRVQFDLSQKSLSMLIKKRTLLIKDNKTISLLIRNLRNLRIPPKTYHIGQVKKFIHTDLSRPFLDGPRFTPPAFTIPNFIGYNNFQKTVEFKNGDNTKIRLVPININMNEYDKAVSYLECSSEDPIFFVYLTIDYITSLMTHFSENTQLIFDKISCDIITEFRNKNSLDAMAGWQFFRNTIAYDDDLVRVQSPDLKPCVGRNKKMYIRQLTPTIDPQIRGTFVTLDANWYDYVPGENVCFTIFRALFTLILKTIESQPYGSLNDVYVSEMKRILFPIPIMIFNLTTNIDTRDLTIFRDDNGQPLVDINLISQFDNGE